MKVIVMMIVASSVFIIFLPFIPTGTFAIIALSKALVSVPVWIHAKSVMEEIESARRFIASGGDFEKRETTRESVPEKDIADEIVAEIDEVYSLVKRREQLSHLMKSIGRTRAALMSSSLIIRHEKALKDALSVVLIANSDKISKTHSLLMMDESVILECGEDDNLERVDTLYTMIAEEIEAIVEHYLEKEDYYLVKKLAMAAKSTREKIETEKSLYKGDCDYTTYVDEDQIQDMNKKLSIIRDVSCEVEGTPLTIKSSSKAIAQLVEYSSGREQLSITAYFINEASDFLDLFIELSSRKTSQIQKYYADERRRYAIEGGINLIIDEIRFIDKELSLAIEGREKNKQRMKANNLYDFI